MTRISPQEPSPTKNDDYDKYALRFVDVAYPTYGSGTVYEVGERVKYTDGEGHLIGYVRKDYDTGTSGNAPSGDLTDNNYWAVDICPKGFAKDDFSSYPEHDDFRYWSRWFYENDIIPVIKKGDDWYILATVTPLGKPDGSTNCSLYWNETDRRLMAVYGSTSVA